MNSHLGTKLIIDTEPDRRKGPRQGVIHKYEVDGDGLYQCPYCPRSYQRGNSLSSHVRAKHCEKSGRKVFKCPHANCKYSNSIRTAVNQHFTRHHCPRTTYNCPFCWETKKTKLYVHFTKCPPALATPNGVEAVRLIEAGTSRYKAGKLFWEKFQAMSPQCDKKLVILKRRPQQYKVQRLKKLVISKRRPQETNVSGGSYQKNDADVNPVLSKSYTEYLSFLRTDLLSTRYVNG
jgi:hypothetical protein